MTLSAIPFELSPLWLALGALLLVGLVTTEPYGRDTSTLFTDRGARIAYGRIVSGKRLLAEACVRRLITQRGDLLDDPNYGFPLKSLLNTAQTKAGLAAIPGLIRNELKKDERVDDVRVTVTLDKSRAPILAMRLDIEVIGVETGPFTLAMLASELRVEVLQLPEAA